MAKATLIQQTNRDAAERNAEAWRLIFDAAANASPECAVDVAAGADYCLRLFSPEGRDYFRALGWTDWQVSRYVCEAIGCTVRFKRCGTVRQIEESGERHEAAAKQLHQQEPKLLAQIAALQQQLDGLREAAEAAAADFHYRRQQREILRLKAPEHLRNATDSAIDDLLSGLAS